MTIDLSEQLTACLRVLADQQGRDMNTLVEEAVRQYLEDGAITDLQPADVAAAQEKLAGELTDLNPWADPSETTDDETQ